MQHRRSLTLPPPPSPSSPAPHPSTPTGCRNPSPPNRRRREEVNLPLDVIRSILAKLEVKSILRFRSVCKSWKQLICDPSFFIVRKKPSPRILVLVHPKLYSSDPTNNKIGLYALDEEEEEEGGTSMPPILLFHLPSNDSSTRLTPYDCDGLVLIHSRTDICVCNPLTKETQHLPAFTRGSHRGRIQYIGFGLDPSTNLYKVVRFFFNYDDNYDDDHQARCEVFTLGRESQSWRRVDYDPPYGFKPRIDSASANGRIYWSNSPTDCWSNSSTDCTLLSFDLRNEDFRLLLPPSTASKWWQYSIVNGGQGADRKLWYVKVVNWVPTTYDIWELTDETTHSWTIIHRIGFKMPTSLYMPTPLPVRPMLVIRDGRSILLCNQVKRLQRYDILSKEYKTILTIGYHEKGEEGDGNRMNGATMLFPSLYRETFVSPNHFFHDHNV